MRPIKFRGRDVESGEHIIYGSGYVDLNGKKYIFDAKTGIAYHVAPDSVAQFCGYDKNGDEIYEGDILQFDYNGVHYEYKAHLGGFATTESGCYITEKQFGTKKLLPDSFKAELS